MKKKFIVFSVLMFLIGVFITSKTGDNLIGINNVDKLYHPFVWSLLLIPLSLLSLTLNEQKHKFWLKFTGIFFLISMIIAYATSERGSSGIFTVDRELTNWFFAGLYGFISIIYFIVQFVKNRK
ncbi:MAG: hypothetical protein ACYCZW_01835 [Minisyncoccota bacterium]